VYINNFTKNKKQKPAPIVDKSTQYQLDRNANLATGTIGDAYGSLSQPKSTTPQAYTPPVKTVTKGSKQTVKPVKFNPRGGPIIARNGSKQTAGSTQTVKPVKFNHRGGPIIAREEMEEFIEFIDSHDNEIMTEAQFDEAAGEKDACYHKVKSRYKVWPSAYASGALVQCRKKGAKNWGNSKKKSNENVEMDSKLDVDKLLTSLRNSKTTNSDRLADAIEMRFMHNMTFKEIGEELNVGPSRAATIIEKALRLLRWHAARSPGS